MLRLLVAVSGATAALSANATTHFSTGLQTKVRRSGWRATDETATAVLGTRRCNVDRRPGLTAAEFDATYRGRKPVVLGSPSLSVGLTEADLAAYVLAVGDTPWAISSPFGRPGVGTRISTLGEYMATFSTQAEKDSLAFVSAGVGAGEPDDAAALLASRNPVTVATAGSAFHCSPSSAAAHPELVDTLLVNRYRHSNSTTHAQMQAMKAGKRVGSPLSLASPALCEAYGMPGDPSACDCAIALLVVGESGAGLPFHWHHNVVGNEQLYGQKRWFLSRHLPPGGFNHRKTHIDWVRTVYPTIPASSFLPNPVTGVPDLLECTLEAGEIMYAPDGFYHATIDVGHSINVNYRCAHNATDAEWQAASEAILDMAEKELPAWRPPQLPVSAALQGALGDDARVNALRSLYEDDPFADALLGKASSRIERNVRLATSYRAKSAVQEALPGGDNFFSMGPSATSFEVDPEIARLIELAVVLHPAEPDFLLFTSKYMVNEARGWVYENIIKPGDESRKAGRASSSPPTPVCEVEATSLLGCAGMRISASAANRLEYAALLNPLTPDNFAFLAMALQLQVGEAGWPVAPQPGSPEAKRGEAVHPYSISPIGFFLLDVALAAARKASRLDPLSPAPCNIAANLLSAGAVDRFTYDVTGHVQYRKAAHVAVGISQPKGSAWGQTTPGSGIPLAADVASVIDYMRETKAYQDNWMRFRGADTTDAGRLGRFSTQLGRCVNLASGALAIADSAEAAEAALAELRSATQSLQSVVPYLSTQHLWFSARTMAAAEAQTIMRALLAEEETAAGSRTAGQGGQQAARAVGADGGISGAAVASSSPLGPDSEVSVELSDSILPLYLPSTRQSLLSPRFKDKVAEAGAKAAAKRQPYPAAEAYELISMLYRKEAGLSTKKAAAAAGKAA